MVFPDRVPPVSESESGHVCGVASLLQLPVVDAPNTCDAKGTQTMTVSDTNLSVMMKGKSANCSRLD